jgi:membrane fusion protein (multidrug efflux system)
MRRSIGAGFAAVLLVAVAAGGAWYWRTHLMPGAAPAGGALPAGKPGGFAIPVEAVKVTIGKVVESVPAVGTLRSNESVIIAPEIAGRISQLDVKEGEKIAAGTVIALLDQSVYQAQIAQIEASLALSKINYQRATDLLQKNYGTAKSKDEAEEKLREDQASLTLAEAQLAKTRLAAPFDGVLGLRKVSIGQYLSPGDAIVNLEQIDPLKVDFRVPEAYFAIVQVGQTIALDIDALPGKQFTGTVYAIDPLLDQNGRAIVIRARIPNPESRLKPGLFVRVSLIYATRDNTILVPEQSIVPIGEKKFVFTVVDGKAKQVAIRTGERVKTMVEVVEGLKPNDVVVTAGQIKIRDGAAVQAALQAAGS